MDHDNPEADWEDDADPENLDDDDMWDFGTKAKSKTSTQTPSTSTSKVCIVCQQPDTLCSNCRKVAYCGKAHQREN
jgi:hypothetical protein